MLPPLVWHRWSQGLCSRTICGGIFLGGFPTIARPSTHHLNCKITRIHTTHCKLLHDLAERHKIHQKLTEIKIISPSVTTSQYQLLYNKWDKEFGDFMISAEKRCHKFKSCSLKYSPTIGQWLCQQAILKWILQWHDDKVPDTWNLRHAARHAKIENAFTLTCMEIEACLVACLQQLYHLRSQAPDLHWRHLQWWLFLECEWGDNNSAQEILQIVKNKAQKQHQQQINQVIKDARVWSALHVSIHTDTWEYHHTQQSDVEQTCATHLGSWFSLGRRTPIHTGQLAQDIGPLSDTEAA